jgi:transposase
MEADMAAHTKRIEIAAEDRPALERWASSRTAERRLVERAQIVLLAAEGRAASEIAERVGCAAETARRQRARYEHEGLDGLRDRPKSGRPMTHDPAVRARLIALACTRPPETEQGMRRERWTLRELAEQVGMSVSRAQSILAEADLRPHLTEQLSELGPDFDAQAAEVCGLYVDLAVRLHPQARLVAQPGRDVLLDPRSPDPASRRLHQPARPRHPDARVRRALQPHRPTVPLDIHRQGARRMTNTTCRIDH